MNVHCARLHSEEKHCTTLLTKLLYPVRCCSLHSHLAYNSLIYWSGSVRINLWPARVHDRCHRRPLQRLTYAVACTVGVQRKAHIPPESSAWCTSKLAVSSFWDWPPAVQTTRDTANHWLSKITGTLMLTVGVKSINHWQNIATCSMYTVIGCPWRWQIERKCCNTHLTVCI